ncbi:MAG: hypothetical protein RSA87_02950 [Malacoplasma sp.]
MNKLETLTNEYIDYIKNIGLYSYDEAYKTDEEAFDNLYFTLNRSAKGTISDVVQDMEILATKQDLRDSSMRKHFDNAYNMVLKLNEYEVDRKKDIELWYNYLRMWYIEIRYNGFYEILELLCGYWKSIFWNVTICFSL